MKKQKDIKEVMVFLQGHGVSTAFAAKIYRKYEKESIAKVKENPYQLADDIWGIGFKIADSIASKMGYEKNDPRRCRSGILYTLNELAEEGHVYAEPEQLGDDITASCAACHGDYGAFATVTVFVRQDCEQIVVK